MKTTVNYLKGLVMAVLFSCTLTGFAQQYGWIDLTANIPDSNYIQRSLRDVYFIGQEGWITGYFESELRVWHTTDGGNTFTIQTVPPNSGNGMGIFMRSLQEGYLVTDEGQVLRTLDGGNNWITIGTGLGLLYSISFPPLPDTSGYICGGWGGKVCRVTGSNIAVEFTTPYTLYSIVFPVNSSEGWVCGGPHIRHRKSTGWVIGDQNYNTGNYYNAIFFIDNQHGWAVGSPSSGNGNIIYTLNGKDWIGVSNLPENSLNDVFFIDNQEGWAVGSYIILHTIDGGLTWTKDQPPLADTVIFSSVFAVNNHELYICGKTGIGELSKQVLLKYIKADGLEEHEDMDFTIFPNPAEDKCKMQNAKCKMADYNIELFDLSGRNVMKVFDGRFPSEGIDFNVSHLPAGVYFIRFHFDDKLMVKKLFKL
jgi:photosystem II stability/assembly factor-like uncharacterized protein